jgi:hypothetical protein
MHLLRTCLVRKNTFLLKRPFRKPIADRKELLKKEFGQNGYTGRLRKAASVNRRRCVLEREKFQAFRRPDPISKVYVSMGILREGRGL